MTRAGAAVGILLAALVAVVLAVVWGGAAQAPPIGDPGPTVRWAGPLVRVVHDLAASATVGLLGLAAFVTPETTRTNRRVEATRLASLTALAWVGAGVLGVLLTFAQLAGVPLQDPTYLPQLIDFVLDLESTRLLVLSLAVGAAVAAGAAVATSRTAMAWLTVLALVALVPLGLAGHATGIDNHDNAVNAMGTHLIGVTIWVGGLLALVLMRRRLGRDLAVSVARFSTVATWCFVAVAASGLVSAWLRLGDLAGLQTRYGWMVAAKVVALAALGVLGWLHRGRTMRRLAADHTDLAAFSRLAVVELLVMGLATGIAVALSRTAPPATETAVAPSRVLELTGYQDPGPVTSTTWWADWRVDWLLLAVALVAIGLYAVGARRLWQRGDRWPWHRLLLWVLGWAVFVYATSGAPGIYGRILFSGHMVMHMIVAMLVPLLLVPAAPITLALRALPARPDKTLGPREVVLAVVHSRYLAVLANPVVAAGIFFFSLAAFYYSPLFELALSTHTGHMLMLAHFFLSGYLFVWVLIGIDPGPPRWSPLILLVILFATMAFHAFFGVVLTGSTTLLAPGFFEDLGLPWVTDPLADQHTGGAIAWGIGEAPTLALAMLVAVAWVRQDRVETARLDRQADRDGDAELAAYNAALADRARRARQ